jgi:flagellar hook-length control protein FliK
MAFSAHPITAAPAALAPVASPSCAPVAGDESPFAKLLSAQPQPQEPAKTEAKTEPEASAQREPDDKPAAPAQDKPAKALTRPAANALRTSRPAASARTATAREAAQPDDAAKDAAKDSAAADTTIAQPTTPAAPAPTDAAPATMDPALAQWLASLNRPAGPASPPVAPAEVNRIAIDGTPAKAFTQGNAVGNEADPRAAKGGEHKLPGFEPVEPSRAAGDNAALVAALVDRPAAAKPREPSTANDPGIAALAAGSTAHAARAEPVAAAAAINLPTPVSSPEFKAALGMQVSVLARDGIQHAQLHLNPAEMGPISVQIALDGNQAQVDFGADSAHTRHLIEAGLPELASALRDAGLTLSGGGVSQHARGQSQDDGAASGRDGGTPRGADSADGAGAAAPRRVNLRLPQGAVDLYA